MEPFGILLDPNPCPLIGPIENRKSSHPIGQTMEVTKKRMEVTKNGAGLPRDVRERS